MSSASQLLANRQNSTHSTGPVTFGGKAASSTYATRHGLTSKHTVIPGENHAEYDEHRESLLDEYRPAGATWRTLFEDIAASTWRLLSARRFETAVLKKILGESADRVRRAFFQNNKLEKKQKERREAQRKSAVRINGTAANPEIGLVTQSRNSAERADHSIAKIGSSVYSATATLQHVPK